MVVNAPWYVLKIFFVPSLRERLCIGKLICIRIRHSSPRTDRVSDSSTLEAKTRSEFGPSRGERVHKYYAYCNSVKSLLITVAFLKGRWFIFATSASSFDKNNRHTTHTVSRNAIIFQAEKTSMCEIKTRIFLWSPQQSRERQSNVQQPNIQTQRPFNCRVTIMSDDQKGPKFLTSYRVLCLICV